MKRKKAKKIFFRSFFCLFLVLYLLLETVLSGFAAESSPEEETTSETTEEGEFVSAEPTDYAENIAFYCVEAGLSLYSKNGDQPVAPYAVAKLVNILVACDSVQNLQESFTIEEGMTCKGSNVYGLKAGDEVSWEDLFVLMLYRGFDDAATVVARKIGGTDEAYTDLMNQKAASLGAVQTYFENPTGREGLGQTTVQDAALLAAALTENDQVMSIAGNGNIKCESLNRTLYNRNFFLSGYYNGIGKSYLNSQVTGLLAGSLIDPQLLIASMVSDHYTYICVVMNVRASEEEAWEYSIAKTILKEYAGTFSKVEVLSPNKIICEIPVSMGKEHDAVVVSPDQSFSFYLTNDVDPETEFSYTYELTAESLEAPVTEGTEVGEIFLYRGDQLVGNAKLLVRANVSRSMSEYYQGQARSIVMGKTFLKALAILVLLSLVYVIITSIIRGQKMKRARKFYKS